MCGISRIRCCIFLICLGFLPIAGAVEGEEKAGELRVLAVGDVMLGGSAGPELANLGYDYPFVHVGPILRAGHVVFGNLEGPLTTRGQKDQDKTYVFRSPPAKVVPALKAAGFNVFSLANNHTLDYGADGLADTLAALHAAQLKAVGAGPNIADARRMTLLSANGYRVAVLAYSLTLPENFYATVDQPGTAFGHLTHVRADVKKARREADVVLVSFHWGQEGKTELRDYQVSIGHAAIDAGANAVLGHHPHILQGVERYKQGVIFYSLGNFVFGSYSKTAARSAIAQLDFAREQDRVVMRGARLLPINVNNIELNFQPQMLTGADADAVVQTLQDLSLARGTNIDNREGVAVVRLD